MAFSFADPPIEQVYAEQVQLLSALSAAIAKGDDEEVRKRAGLARRRRLRFARVRQALGQASTAELTALAQEITRHDATFAAWIAGRKRPGDDRLATGESVERVADTLLPLEWDLQLGLIVLCGRNAEPLVRALRARGQERILLALPPDQSASELPTGAHSFSSAGELRRLLIEKLDGPPLPQLTIFRVENCEPNLPTSEQITQLVVACRDELISNYGTAVFQDRLCIEQTLTNLPKLGELPTVAALAGCFAGRPGLLVSPGPSLKKNIDQLLEIKRTGSAVIITSPQALRPLLGRGIVPDIAMVGDPWRVDDFFVDCPAAELGALVLGMSCFPQLFTWPTPIFSYPLNGRHDGWLEAPLGPLPILPSGGSVACTAFSLLYAMGCDPIVLCGQDLAFSGDQVYVEGGALSQSRARVDEKGQVEIERPQASTQVAAASEFFAKQAMVELPGYYGGTVRSAADYARFHSWFVHVAREMAGQRKLYNCTEGGAFITGMEHRPLSEIAKHYFVEPFDPPARLKAAHAEPQWRNAWRAQRVQNWRQQFGALLLHHHGRVSAAEAVESAYRAVPLVAACRRQEYDEARARLHEALFTDEEKVALDRLSSLFQQTAAALLPLVS